MVHCQRGGALDRKGDACRADIAVLYRENFQSRALEEAMLASGVPYRVLGTRFFERKEVKDVISYLRAALNPKSRVDMGRIVGVPARGIGKTTLEKMLAGQDATLPAAARKKVEAFRALLEAIRSATGVAPTSEAVHFAIEQSGMETMLKNGSDEDKERLNNLRELVNFAARFDHIVAPEGIERLLEEAALQSEQDSLEERENAVSLMTVHASKGLEFDAVFVTGLEQGLFPSQRENDASRDPEEERRLFYVALTRAKQRLFLSYARERSKWGSRDYTLRSEFLNDIDPRLITGTEFFRSGRRGYYRGMKRRGARLGQHFLKTAAYARMLVAAAGVGADDTVVEIGPGKGALTKHLLDTGAHVIAIEKDEALVEHLKETFAENITRGTLVVEAADVRDYVPPAENYVVAANIPYYITGEIIRQFLTAEHQPRTIALLVQKEVAKRIVDKKESILSLSVKAYGSPRIVTTVNRRHFSPPPSVDSAILLIERISRDFFDTITEEQFFNVVRAGFSSKRKMLAGNLGKVFGKEKAVSALTECEIPEKARAEEVSIEKWKEISLSLERALLR